METLREFFRYVGNQFMSVELTDIIDILIVAFFLYYLFKFVRDRRAGKLALGVLLLILMLLISSWLEMRVTNYILEKVIDVGLIALIIVFQPELRAMLEKMGGESLKGIKGIRTNNSQTYKSKISEICYAAENLSESKTGALIIFERTTKLGDVIKTGTIIDADISSFLIGNIFFNKAPLHDGALIIRNERLYAAGCFLPLSTNPDIVKDLGTRHRAGIGMSENSDAVVLIVSEETGVISVAVDGVLKRGFSKKSLEKYLNYLLIPEPKNKKINKPRIFSRKRDDDDEKPEEPGNPENRNEKNPVTKENREKKKPDKQKVITVLVMVSALFVAVLLWFYVLDYDSPEYEKKFNAIDVKVNGAAELKEKNGFSILSDFEFSVDVTVYGKKSDVNRLADDDIQAFIDVSKLDGNGQVPVLIQTVLPNGIKLRRLSTDTVYIYVDRSVKAEIPVEAEITDYVLGSGVTLGTPVCIPKTVSVEGPEGVINNIAKAYARVNLGHINSSATATVPVELFYENGEKVSNSYINLIDKNVEIRIDAFKEKDVPIKIYFTGGVISAENAVFEMSVETVRIRGKAEDADALKEIRINIDERKLGKEGIIYERIVMPAGIENVTGKTETEIKFKFNEIAVRTFSVPKEHFILKNMPEGKRIKINDKFLNIKFMGLIDPLRYFSAEDFHIIIDFENIDLSESGEYYVPADISVVKSRDGVYASGDYAVSVTVLPD